MNISAGSRIVALLTWLAFGCSLRAQCQPGWTSGFYDGVVKGSYSAGTVFDDGTGPSVFIDGRLDDIGRDRLLKWTGDGWSPVPGPCAMPVRSMAVFDDDGAGPGRPALYMVACVDEVAQDPGVLGRWDGRTWLTFGRPADTYSGISSVLVVYDDDGPGPRAAAIYHAGRYARVGGLLVNSIARWNGAAWEPLAGGLTTGTLPGDLRAASVYDADGEGPGQPVLVVAGGFSAAGGESVSNIAAWDGVRWSPLGAGVDGRVRKVVMYDADGPGPATPLLVAAGEFQHAGGQPAAGIASWDGSTWRSLGMGISGQASAMTVFDPDDAGPAHPELIVGGSLTAAGGVPVQALARWNGREWSAIGELETDFVTDLIAVPPMGGYPPRLFASTSQLWFAEWSGAEWRLLTRGATDVNPWVGAMSPFPDPTTGAPRLIVGGHFDRIGEDRLSSIAAWDGHDWLELAGGVSGPGAPTSSTPAVHSLAIFDPDGQGPADRQLIVGGRFTGAGAVPANSIASWDGLQWSPLGTGIQGDAATVTAMAPFDEDGAGPLPPTLFVAGQFTTAGDVTTTCLARWDGQSWSSLPRDIEGSQIALFGYKALTVFDSDGDGPAEPTLYVAGTFITAPYQALQLARWTGTRWETIPGAPTGAVAAAMVYDEDGPGPARPSLVIGGAFTSAGGIAVHGVAAWDGTSWARLGDDSVLGSVRVSINTLYVHDEDGPGPATPVLCAGGLFQDEGEVRYALATWDGAKWTRSVPAPPTTVAEPVVRTFSTFDDSGGTRPRALYVGGSFRVVDDVPSGRIARWGCGAPPPCPADFDGDGLVDFTDFLLFMNRYEVEDPSADLTGDGVVDASDYLEFLNQYDLGC